MKQVAVQDRGEIRHDRTAVASEDTFCVCRLMHLLASVMACHEIIRRMVPRLVSCLHGLAGSNGKVPIAYDAYSKLTANSKVTCIIWWTFCGLYLHVVVVPTNIVKISTIKVYIYSMYKTFCSIVGIEVTVSFLHITSTLLQ